MTVAKWTQLTRFPSLSQSRSFSHLYRLNILEGFCIYLMRFAYKSEIIEHVPAFVIRIDLFCYKNEDLYDGKLQAKFF